MSAETLDLYLGDRSSALDKGVRLLGQEMTRKLSFGSDWTELALGVYGFIEGAGNLTLPNGGFRVGATTNSDPDINGSGSHWIGFGYGSDQTWTQFNGTGYRDKFYTAGTYYGVSYLTVTGSTVEEKVSNPNGADLSGCSFDGVTGGCAMPLFCLLTRTSATSITVQNLSCVDSTAAGVSIQESDFIEGMTCGNITQTDTIFTSAYGVSFYTLIDHSKTSLDEASHGYFDSISFIWKPTTRYYYCLGIAACKWS